MITKRKIPHGSVAVTGIKDQPTRDVAMRMNENTASLASQLDELQTVCQVMERDLKAALAKITVLEAV